VSSPTIPFSQALALIPMFWIEVLKTSENGLYALMEIWAEGEKGMAGEPIRSIAPRRNNTVGNIL